MDDKNKTSRFAGILSKAKERFEYYTTGVWKDPSDTIKIRLIKTINLSVRSFLNKDLQSVSMSLTYVTVLAIVPMLAILFAFGRAFGLQNYIEQQVYLYFPSQHQALSTAFTFVDSYLKQSSQGVFLGVGLVLLLWTVVSLMSRIEDTFNQIWDINRQRTFFRKVIDYTAFCIFVPILMILSSGVSIVVSTTLDQHLKFLSPIGNVFMDALPFFLVWVAFTFSFVLIPNTRVQFKFGAIAGFFCGVAFQFLQLLFVNGQIYVSKYNAVYGSFAFLPLLLIWLQLSWLILLCGCMITYSAQNVFGYNYTTDASNISESYFYKISIIILGIVVRRFNNMKEALSFNSLAAEYDLPVSIVKLGADKLKECGFVTYMENEKGEMLITLSYSPDKLSVRTVLTAMQNNGSNDFIPRLRTNYDSVLEKLSVIIGQNFESGNDLLIGDLEITEHPTE